MSVCRYLAETALARAQLEAGSQSATAGLTGKQWFAAQEGKQASAAFSALALMLQVRS